jgi:hypothetical protein
MGNMAGTAPGVHFSARWEPVPFLAPKGIPY